METQLTLGVQHGVEKMGLEHLMVPRGEEVKREEGEEKNGDVPEGLGSQPRRAPGDRR